ncbi:MAG: CBS domain-containing protein [Anaerolineae bacterium]
MITVRDLLRRKGHDVWSVTPDTTVYDALRLMADKNIGAVLVLDGDQVVGILSERDYARKVVLRGRSSLNTPVSDIMTTKVYYVHPDQSIEECMGLMTDKRIRHLPVVEDGRLVGVISIGDVVKEIIEQQGITIRHLENYIMGVGYGR